MTAPRRHRLGPRRDPAVDAAVLDATREMLVEVGYAGTTFEGISRRSSVSRPAMYRRWPSKAMLVHEAVFPERSDEATEPRPFADEIGALVRGAAAFFSSPPARAAIPGLMLEIRSDPALRELFAARLEHAARRRFSSDVLARAVASGHARSDVDPDIVFDAIAGAVLFAVAVREVDDLETFGVALAELLLGGLAARN